MNIKDLISLLTNLLPRKGLLLPENMKIMELSLAEPKTNALIVASFLALKRINIA